MENKAENIDDLIGKVLTAEATADERAAVESWVREEEANRKYFDQLKTIFDKSAASPVKLQFDTDAAWRKVKEKIAREGLQKSESREIRLPRHEVTSTDSTKRWQRVAASVLIVLAGSYGVYQVLRPKPQVQIVASGMQTRQDTLPDGTTAFLNRKSEVRFEYNSRQQTRKVKLTGEAFFEVKHEEEKPFIIETGEVLIKDLGTAFNVKAYPENNTVEVVVEEGEVQIYTLTDSGLNLSAGEKGIYDKAVRKFSKLVKADTNSLSYKTNVFSFNNTDLGSVVDKLNEVYGSKIRLANKTLRDCHLTVNFSDDKLETVIDVLAETMSLTVTRRDEEIILDGKGCSY